MTTGLYCGPVTRVLIVDDDAFTRTMIRRLLTADGLEVVGDAADGDQVLDAVAEHRPDVVLVDLLMHRVGGVEAIARVMALPDPPYCVALTSLNAEDAVVQAVEAGASGFLSKNEDQENLAAHVRSVAGGNGILGTEATTAVLRRMREQADERPNRGAEARAKIALLTDREREIAAFLVDGLGNTQIARRLHLSEETVKVHLAHARAKLGGLNRTQLAVLLALAGLGAAS